MEEKDTTPYEEGSEEGGEETPEETPEEPEGEMPPEELPEEPPVRKSAEYWQSEKEKLEAKRARADYFKTKQEMEGEEDGDIRSAIQEELEPIKQAFNKQINEKEFQDTLTKYPDAKKFEATIRKYSAAYQNVPIELITRGILYGRQEKKAQADEEAKASRLGGHSRRPQEVKLPDFTKMSDQELMDYERKVRQSQ